MKKFLLLMMVGLLVGFCLGGVLIPKILTNKPAAVVAIKITATPSITPTPTPSLPQSTSSGEKKVKEATSSSKKIFGVGQLCGGVGKIPCPPELICVTDPSDTSSSGFCQKP